MVYMRFDRSSATCNIYVFKEGLLSSFGHDLCVTVSSFLIEISDDARSITARFDPESVHVGCAVVNGVENPDRLKEDEKKEIDRNIFVDVLQAAFFREISLKSSSVTKEDTSYNVDATLNLHGKEKQIYFTVKDEGENLSADIWLHLPDFGIKPFSALFGTLRIKPDVLIRIKIPSGPLQNAVRGISADFEAQGTSRDAK